MKTKFWKSVGGYVLCVKLGGCWYYVGSTGAEDVAFHNFMRLKGMPLDRVQGMPKTLANIWNKHGSTIKAIRENLPFWREYFD
jgi:hypothetical protein